MSDAPDPTAPPASPRATTTVYAAIGTLLLLGTVLFATGVVAKVRQPENAPPATVLGVPAWQVATAGFVSTLAGGLWLRRYV